jgi:hypothetical protein
MIIGLLRQRYICLCAMMALTLVSSAVHAATADGVTYQLSFDGTTLPTVQARPEAPTVYRGLVAANTSDVTYRPGVYGQAIELGLGPTGVNVRFKALDNLPVQTGTVEMWVMPKQWYLNASGDYLYHQRFFNAQNGSNPTAGWFQIYKFHEGGFWCVRGTSSAYAAQNTIVDYTAVIGRWVHLVTTYHDSHVQQFVNGMLFESDLKPLSNLPSIIVLGDAGLDPAISTTDTPTTLMDELKIYNRVLTAAEIRTSYANGMAELARRSQPTMGVPAATTAPIMDGNLLTSPGEWASASRLIGFRRTVAEISPSTSSSAIGVDPSIGLSLAHDATHLYLAFQRPHQTGENVSAPARARDADLSGDDSVVVELAPNWNGSDVPGTSYRFELSSMGSTADAKVDAANVPTTAWNPTWTASTTVNSSQSVLEMRIPLAALERTSLGPNESWAARILSRRVILGSPKTEWYWGGIPGTVKNGVWGRLVLRSDATAVRVKTLQTTRGGALAASADLIAGSTLNSVMMVTEVPGRTASGYYGSAVRSTPLSASGTASLATDGQVGDQGAVGYESAVINRANGEVFWSAPLALDLEKGAVLGLTLRPSLGVAQVQVGIAGTGIDPGATPITITLVPTLGGAAVFTKVLGAASFVNQIAQFTIPISGLVPAGYTLRSSVTLPGAGAPTIKELTFTKPEEASWRNSQDGILPSGQVPEPWTALTQATHAGVMTISCWGRQYRFDASPLPSQITSQGQELLSSKAVLVGEKAGVETIWTATGFRVVEATNSKITFTGTGTLGGASLVVTGFIEYDGLIWYTLSGDLSATDFDRVSFLLPMDTSNGKAAYRMTSGSMDGVKKNSGTNLPWTSALIHALWFGNEQVGISWLAESDQHWKIATDQPRLELAQSSVNSLVFRVNLVSGGTRDVTAGSFSFGVHPTPARPMPPHWRRNAMNNRNAFVAPWMMRYHGYPMLPEGAARDTALATFASTMPSWRRLGDSVAVSVYLHSGMISDKSPEWSYFGAEWNNPTNLYPKVPEEEAHDQGLHGVCPASDGWIDFDVTNIKKFLTETGLDGVYHDFGAPSVCSNAKHGCDQRMPLLADRELHKRLYVVQRQLAATRGRQSWYMHHISVCSGLLATSQASFADTIVDSEQIAGLVPTRGADLFIRQLPLEFYRIRGSAKPFGITNNFIINRDPALPGNYGMCLVHDIVSQFGGPGWQTWGAIADKLRTFGLTDDDVEFRGYWEGKGGASVTHAGQGVDDVLMSLYLKPRARAVAILVNRSNAARTETLSWDTASLGIQGTIQASDLETGISIPLTGNACLLTMQPLQARYIQISAIPPTVVKPPSATPSRIALP